MAKFPRFLIGLILVFATALLFRFWQLTRYPTSLSMDEVAIGYGSYSLLKTGRDEWGKILPVAFYSVGDYKPPVNYYFEILPIALLGLSEFAVRLPVALLGSLSIPILMIFLRKLHFSWPACLLSGLWLAILPWHVHYSRYGLEAITALTFLLVGITAFFTALHRHSYWWTTVSLVSFAISVWAYHSNRLFVPLLFIFLTLTYSSSFHFLLKSKIKLILTALIFMIVTAPFVYLTLFSSAIRTRAAMTSILREPALALTLHHGNYNNFLQAIFDNDIYLVFHHWVGKYLGYYDIRFWFWKGIEFTPPGYPGLGLLYTVDLPLFVLGIIWIVKKPFSLIQKLALFWFFIGPLASSFTMNEQHTLRTLVWLPFFGLIMAGGFQYLLDTVSLRWLWGIYALLLFWNVALFHDLYVYQLPRYFAEYWQYGYKDISLYACAHKHDYDRIVISPVFGSLGPLLTGIPDYYVLFYCRYDPAKYQLLRRLDNIYISRVDWVKEKEMHLNSLLISPRWDYPFVTAPSENVIKRIDYPNESPAFYFVETRTGLSSPASPSSHLEQQVVQPL